MGGLDPLLHVCHRIFPLGINLGYDVNREIRGVIWT